MIISLLRGQNTAIASHHFTVGLGWDPSDTRQDFDLDITACMLTAQDETPSDDFVVYYNNHVSADKALRLSGDNRVGGVIDHSDLEEISVDLTRIAPEITSIVFSASIHEAETRRHNFGLIRNAYIRIVDRNGKELCIYELTEDFSVETAVEFGRLYRAGDEWKFEATGLGHKDGLQGIFNKYCL